MQSIWVGSSSTVANMMMQKRLLHGARSSNYHYPIYSKSSMLKPKSKEEAKLVAAKKHSQAERRRRMRINGQYSTLRTILPNIIKTDKASILAETIRNVRELKKFVSELKTASGIDGRLFPDGTEKLSLEYCDDGDEAKKGLVKATVSCVDKPELMSELAKAVRSIKGTTVRAEIATVGGRTKCILWVKELDKSSNDGLVMLKKALKGVMIRSSSSSRVVKKIHMSI